MVALINCLKMSPLANLVTFYLYFNRVICVLSDDMSQIRSEAQALGKSMNLSVVRLCFQAFLPDEHGRFTIPVDPVFSHKVYDSSKYIFSTCTKCTPVHVHVYMYILHIQL